MPSHPAACLASLHVQAPSTAEWAAARAASAAALAALAAAADDSQPPTAEEQLVERQLMALGLVEPREWQPTGGLCKGGARGRGQAGRGKVGYGQGGEWAMFGQEGVLAGEWGISKVWLEVRRRAHHALLDS